MCRFSTECTTGGPVPARLQKLRRIRAAHGAKKSNHFSDDMCVRKILLGRQCVQRTRAVGRKPFGSKIVRFCASLFYSVMIFRITRSVSRMPWAASTPTWRMVSSTSLPMMPWPGWKLLPPRYML